MNISIDSTPFGEVFKITSDRHEDERGGLIRSYNHKDFCSKLGKHIEWKEESISLTKKKGTIRGLHLSLPPAQEAKLLLPLKGEMYWVIVDLRNSSQTFGEKISFILSPDSPSYYIPKGFAHGCQSLEDNTEIFIKSDEYYLPDSGIGINAFDKELNINWPSKEDYYISDRDKSYSTYSSVIKKL